MLDLITGVCFATVCVMFTAMFSLICIAVIMYIAIGVKEEL